MPCLALVVKKQRANNMPESLITFLFIDDGNIIRFWPEKELREHAHCFHLMICGNLPCFFPTQYIVDKKQSLVLDQNLIQGLRMLHITCHSFPRNRIVFLVATQRQPRLGMGAEIMLSQNHQNPKQMHFEVHKDLQRAREYIICNKNHGGRDNTCTGLQLFQAMASARR